MPSQRGYRSGTNRTCAKYFGGVQIRSPMLDALQGAAPSMFPGAWPRTFSADLSDTNSTSYNINIRRSTIKIDDRTKERSLSPRVELANAQGLSRDHLMHRRG